MTDDPAARYGVEELTAFAAGLFGAAGLEDEKARTVAEVLVEGDLLGHTTHGLALAAPYLRAALAGGMSGAGEPVTVSERGAALCWDGRRLPGPWLVVQAIEAALARVGEHGLAAVAIRESHHIACLASYLERATSRGCMILLTCSDPSEASVAPFGGLEALFTPDPIAIGIPAAGEPILIDMSASITTNGMTARLRGQGRRFPGPWAMTAAGEASDDPNVLFTTPPGTLLPTGGLDHGHKGYNLALAIEALSQGLSGHGRADPRTAWGASVYLQVIDPAAFGGAGRFPAPDRLPRGRVPAQSAGARGRRGAAARRAQPRPQARGAQRGSSGSTPASWKVSSPGRAARRRPARPAGVSPGSPAPPQPAGGRGAGAPAAPAPPPAACGRGRDPALGRPIALLSTAAFVSVASMRVADPLLPQVAQEFGVSAGEASLIATAFALAYGLCQLIYGALGDRFGKYRLVALMTLISALTVASAGFAGSLAVLGIARFAAGATAAAIVPLGMAFVGDHVPYRERQAVLARFLTGTIFGLVGGQILGGLVGELVGWRAVFLLLGALFLLVGALLLVELRSSRVPAPVLTASLSPAALARGYALLFGRPWARIVLATVFVEGLLFYGAFTFIGAWLRVRFALDYAMIGVVLSCFGLGGLVYALTVRRLMDTLGERGLALGGGAILTLGFIAVASGPLALMAPAIAVLGLGMYMLHATLQTNATQMAPEARGLAVSTFANALFLGQAAGVWLAGLAIDRIGFAPVFAALGGALTLLGATFAALLGRRPVAS